MLARLILFIDRHKIGMLSTVAAGIILPIWYLMLCIHWVLFIITGVIGLILLTLITVTNWGAMIGWANSKRKSNE